MSFMGPRQWFAEVEGSTPLRSCGLVMPFADVEIWDEHNQPLPPGQPGQIVARIDGQMTGFWNDPEGTTQRMVDGWVLTGDIGTIDKNGYLYLLDRADDMIISGGFNIWPMELENAIAEAPGGDGGGGVRHPGPALGRDALRRRRAEAGRARRRGRRDPALHRPARLLQEAGQGGGARRAAAQDARSARSSGETFESPTGLDTLAG